ncbi:MAG: septum formation inhibitor Maf [Clostridiales bacterium]|jgi:septum formation protein|nr:septum formation inhibitor Maf [Clostridiales bacterium]
MRVILASSSPRRKQLMARMGLQFEVIPSNCEEKFLPGQSPVDISVELALQKARDVSGRINEPALVIGADTIVVKQDKLLGKPKNKDEAYMMLHELQGQVHEVITGLAVIDTGSHRCLTGYERTQVELAPLTPQEIEWYINTGEPMDKAGAYAIQGFGGILVSRIEGCYYNVVGLPIHRLWVMLKQIGVHRTGGIQANIPE